MKKSLNKSIIMFICLILVVSLMGCSTSNTAATGPKAEQGGKAGDNSQTPDKPAGNTDKQTSGNTSPGKGGDEGQNVKPGELKQWDGVKGKILTDDYPAEINKYLTDNQSKETQQAFNINNKTYIVLTMGQKPTAGYLIELKDMSLKDGALKVFVKYEKPGKDDMAAEVITYPSLVIETDDIYEGHYEILYDIEK